MQLNKLIVHNFGSFADSEFTFQDGLWLIEGENGSGKSFFFSEAITWLLFEQTCRGLKFNDVIRNGTEKTVVIGVFDNDLTITRSKSRSRTSTIDINGAEITQAEVEDIVGMDYNTFTSSIIHAQSFSGFADLSENEQKTVLTKLLNLEKWDEYKAKVDIEIQNVKQKLTKLSSEMDYPIKRKGELINQDFSKAKEEFEIIRKTQVSEIKGKIKQVEQNITKYNSQLVEIDRRIKTLKIFEKCFESVNNRYKELEFIIKEKKEEERTIYSNFVSRTRELDTKQNDKKRIEKLEGNCPTCLQKVTEKSKNKCLKEIDSEIKSFIKIVKELKEKLDIVTDSIKQIESASNAFANQLKILEKTIFTIKADMGMQKSIMTNIEDNQTLINNLEENLKSVNNQVFPLNITEEATQKEIKDLEILITKNNKEFSKEEIYLKYLEFWGVGFSNKGIKSYILDQIIPELTVKANNYIQNLTESNISIYFDTQREKKAGGFSEKFTIIIKDNQGERPYNAWSGGEKKRIAVAIDLALSDMSLTRSSRVWDFIVFDEVFENLDEEGKDMMMYLLENIMQERKRVIVISHDPTIKNLIDNKITVIKKGGVSSLEKRHI
jgi:DNA repair exonuclease SbcCD ATPase subunit